MAIFAFTGRLSIDVFIRFFGWMIRTAFSLFVIVSIVLFIKDGILARREGRGRKKIYTVMFIISMAIIALVMVLLTLLCILSMLVMRSM